MEASSYKLTAGQIACLSAVAAGRYTDCNRCADYPQAVSLTDKFAEAGSQALRNACVANAVTALVEYFEDGKNRLSAQYLIEVTRLAERDWLNRNLDALASGRPCEVDFASAFEGPVAQVKMLVAANGAKSPATASFIDSFGKQIARRLAADNGTRIRRAFEALERYGICRFRLWPYANVASVAEAADGSFPPGAHEDARKHRVMNGLYILRAPNNVDEIRGILSGANGRRRMPVCVGVDVFDGCDDETFAFPSCATDGSVATFKGIHEMLLVGYRDDRAFAGGGFFIVRNSWGTDWGKDGYGRIPYAYIECFCREAGTILQDLVDYVGERGLSATVRTGHPLRAAVGWGLVTAALVGGGVWGFWAHREYARPCVEPAEVEPAKVVAAATNAVPAVVEAETVEIHPDLRDFTRSHRDTEVVQTNVEARVEPEVPVAKPEPPAVEPTPPVLRASVSPCKTINVSTAGLQNLTRRHGATEVVPTNVVAVELEPVVAEPTPPVLRVTEPLQDSDRAPVSLRASEPPCETTPSPCETTQVSTAGLQNFTRRHGATEVVATNVVVVEPEPPVVEPTPPNLRASEPPCETTPSPCETSHVVVAKQPVPPVEKVPQHILISAPELDAKVYGFLLRTFYRNREVSVRRGAAKGEIVVTARTSEPIRAALVGRFAVEETDATHWTVREKPREYAFSMRFFCEDREEFEAVRACLMRTDVPFAVEILSPPNADVRWLDATVTFRSSDGKVPNARRDVGDFLQKNGVGGEGANWRVPNKIRSIQKL